MAYGQISAKLSWLLHTCEPRRGEDEILAFLARYPEHPDAAAHRAKALEEVPSFEEIGAASRS